MSCVNPANFSMDNLSPQILIKFSKFWRHFHWIFQGPAPASYELHDTPERKLYKLFTMIQRHSIQVLYYTNLAFRAYLGIFPKGVIKFYLFPGVD